MSDAKKIVLALVGVLVLFAGLLAGRVWRNTFHYAEKKIDEATSYTVKKQVEDYCRAMLASYEADRLTYEQYKDSENTEQQSWAEQARMRANKTASTYNNYVLENSYVWQRNVPPDIRASLSYIN